MNSVRRLSVIEITVDGFKMVWALNNSAAGMKNVDSVKYQADYLKSHIANLIRAVVAKTTTWCTIKTIVPNDCFSGQQRNWNHC